MQPPLSALGVALAAAVVVLLAPAVADAEISKTRSCERTSGGVTTSEKMTASVVITEGDKTIAGGDFAEDASPRGTLTITVSATGTNIPSTFTATLNGLSATGPAPGTAVLVAPRTNGPYTVVIVIAAPVCNGKLRLDAPITVGRAESPSTGDEQTPDDVSSDDDMTPPTVKPRPVTAKRGYRMRFPYRVVGETDATLDTIDIRRRRGATSIASTDVTSSSTGIRRATLMVPAAAARGKWWWCVTSIDANGNESAETCARLTLR